MHAVIITLELTEITHSEYQELSLQLAPMIAAVPGLLAKVWLTDAKNGYGGMYLFADASAAHAFLGSELAGKIAAHPNVAGMDVRHFEVDERATAQTQPLRTIVESVPVP